MCDFSIVFYVFDDLNRFLDGFALNTGIFRKVERNDGDKIIPSQKKFIAVRRVDGYLLSVFSNLIKISDFYCGMIIGNLIKTVKFTPTDFDINIKLQLVRPKVEILDYAWNKRISYLIYERQELENAMSWLSTLGGAFSALGDSFESHAKVAGKISLQQFKIAYHLGEPLLVARCKLYMALSLIQLGKLTVAKEIIEKQFQLAKISSDTKLQNMCKGMWAKLQHAFKQRKNFNSTYNYEVLH